MLHRKNADKQPSAEEQALHQRVYDMMELDRSKQVEAAKKAEEESAVIPEEAVVPPSSAEPLDIFKGLKTDSPITQIEPETINPEPPEAEAVPAELPQANTQELVDLYDDAIDKVIDEIVVSESDALLAAEDLAANLKTLPPKPKSKSKLGRLFKK